MCSKRERLGIIGTSFTGPSCHPTKNTEEELKAVTPNWVKSPTASAFLDPSTDSR